MSDKQEWKDIEDMIKRVAEQEPLPEALTPEAIEKKLKVTLEAEEAGRNTKKTDGKSRNWKRRIPVWASLVAACLVLVLIVSNVLPFSETKTNTEEKKTHEIAKLENLEEVIFGASSEKEIFEQIDRVKNPDKYISISQRILNGFDNLFDAVTIFSFSGAGMNGIKESDHSFMAGDYKEYSMELEEAANADIMDVGSAENKSEDYSETNVQEQGVGEADVVITDGKYFYIRRENKNEIAIVQVDGVQMNTVSQITWPETNDEEEQYMHEFYVSGDKLMLMKTVFQYYASEEGKVRDSVKEETWTEVYDISDRQSPKLISVLKQDGSYDSSRMTNGYLYVFSDHYVYDNIQQDVPESYMPSAQGEVIKCGNIYVPEEAVDSAQYKVITSVNLEAPEGFQTEKAVLCGSGWCYVSANAIYFLTESYETTTEDGYNKTDIWKFAYRDGEIVGTAIGAVKGEIRDQFAMSEENGYLRVVTTYRKYNPSNLYARGKLKMLAGDFIEDSVSNYETSMKNGLYILDENLNLTGSLEDLAKDERIYSARFFAETAYFVTFRETDPLFSVDVSDPTNPVLLGELKIPGFSEYLHPYGEGRLLGIGYEADQYGSQTGIKLSMFDITDPANVKEIHKESVVVFNDRNNYSSPAMYNHKAVLANPEKNLIGFNLTGYLFAGKAASQNNAYVIYGYDEEQGFYLKQKTELTVAGKGGSPYNMDDEDAGKCSEIRGAYIGNYFYTINKGYTIQCFDMENNFELKGEYRY